MGNKQMQIVDQLLKSEEPAIQYKVRVGVLGENGDGRKLRSLRQEIRDCRQVRGLLVNQQADGSIAPVDHVYRKWVGAHWILASLADIGYPPRDTAMRSAVGQVLDRWLAPERIAVKIVNGRVRRCASMEGNALFSSCSLGFGEDRVPELVRRLVDWQWSDGGWNCDCRPEAAKSSFWESLIPLRGLARYRKATGDASVDDTIQRAAEFFLKHNLYRRVRNGKLMNKVFVRLHYPCYWRYDILFGLKVMAEAGFIRDPRCDDALSLLQAKQLPEGGWAANERFYRTSPPGSCRELVEWGSADGKHMNEWVTADALVVLKAAGRFHM